MYLGWKGRCHVWGAHSEHRVKHMLCGRISQPQHYWHLGLDDYLFWEAALDTVECLAASLASTHWMLVVLSSCDNQMSLQTLISAPKELESLPAENCCSVGKRVSRKIGSGCRSWEDFLEEGMTTHSGILAYRIPWTEEPGELQPMGSLSIWRDWSHSEQMHRGAVLCWKGTGWCTSCRSSCCSFRLCAPFRSAEIKLAPTTGRQNSQVASASDAKIGP